jgi:endonuclease/exonuclease/phosphatase family metal-dependent hydrolase
VELTLLTWNLKGSQGPDTRAVVDHLRDSHADLVALQEVQHHQARAITEGLGAASLRWGFKHWPLRTWPEGMAVIGVTRPARVRTHALSFRFRPWSWRRRIFQIAVVDLGGSTVMLANTHLSPHAQPTARAREVETVLGAVYSVPGPVVVAGDLNDTPDADIFARFRAAGFRDAWTVLHPDGAETDGATNWRGWRPGTAAAPSQRLDYVLVPQGTGVVQVVVPRHGEDGFTRFAALSDHLPVAATLVFGPVTTDATAAAGRTGG